MIHPARATLCDNLRKPAISVAGVTLRREKAPDFSGCKSRPETGSLHPVATETAVEATKLSELSMKRIARRLRERTGKTGVNAEQVPDAQSPRSSSAVA